MNDKILEALGEELATQVKAKLGSMELAIANDGSYMPVEKHDKLKSEYKALQEQYDQSSKQIEELSSKSGETEGLQEQLKTLSAEYETFKTESTKREANYVKGNALKELLRGSFNPDAVDLLVGTFNLDEISLNEAGKIVDGELKMQRLAEAKPSLKLSEVIEGDKPKDRQTKDTVDYSKMSDEEYFAAQRDKGE